MEIIPANEDEILLHCDGFVASAKKEDSILLLHPCFDRTFLKSILTQANVHFYAPEGCTVYGDERFLFVLANEAVTGALCFPKTVTVENVFSGERFENTQKIPFVADAKRSFLFRYL